MLLSPSPWRQESAISTDMMFPSASSSSGWSSRRPIVIVESRVPSAAPTPQAAEQDAATGTVPPDFTNDDSEGEGFEKNEWPAWEAPVTQLDDGDGDDNDAAGLRCRLGSAIAVLAVDGAPAAGDGAPLQLLPARNKKPATIRQKTSRPRHETMIVSGGSARAGRGRVKSRQPGGL